MRTIPIISEQGFPNARPARLGVEKPAVAVDSDCTYVRLKRHDRNVIRAVSPTACTSSGPNGVADTAYDDGLDFDAADFPDLATQLTC